MIDMRDAIFDEIYNIAKEDKDVIFMTADAPAHSLIKFQKDFPERYINTGVSEQSMILASAGLAMSGKKVFIHALIPFLALRCYEQIKVNICSMNLPVTIIGGGAGLSFGYDGPTHHAVCDIAVMRTLPELTIYNPCDSSNVTNCIRQCYQSDSPNYIRLDKGVFKSLSRKHSDDGFSIVKHGKDVCIISTGITTHTALDAAKKLKKNDIDIGVIDLYRIKPINILELHMELERYTHIVTLEENSIIGGVGSIIAESLCDYNLHKFLYRIAIKDEQTFIYGERHWLHKKYKIDADSVFNAIINLNNWRI